MRQETQLSRVIVHCEACGAAEEATLWDAPEQQPEFQAFDVVLGYLPQRRFVSGARCRRCRLPAQYEEKRG
ncbi:MAG: hypothetical protein ACO1OB_20700 [Archangium sp.]